MLSIQKDVSLKNFSNYKIGGPARFFAEVSSKKELIKVLRWWDSKINSKIKPEKKVAKLFHLSGDEAGATLPAGRQVFILGGGTNVLISDKGFDGLVIHNKIKDIKILEGKDIKILSEKDIYVSIGAGVLMEDLLTFCIKNSLSGFEWAGGLPGTLGGAIRGNAGAFKGEIKDAIVQIVSIADVIDRKGNFAIKTRNKKECHFGYRNSIFKTNPNEIIISATLKLQKGDKKLIQQKIEEKINYRRERHPLEFPNIGSIFKNTPLGKVPQKLLKQLKDSIKNDPFPILPTAKLLALAGLKGKRIGGSMVSQKHPNFIVNFDNATSRDVLDLISEIKSLIYKKYQIELEEEITII